MKKLTTSGVWFGLVGGLALLVSACAELPRDVSADSERADRALQGMEAATTPKGMPAFPKQFPP